MQAHAFELGGAERAALVPDRVGDSQATEIVHEPRSTYEFRVIARQPVGLRGREREVRHAARMADRPGRLQVGEVGDRLESGVELRVGEHDLERRLRIDHRRPAGQLVEAAEQLRRAGTERLHQARVELGAAALPGDRHRRVHSVCAVEGHHHVGEVHHARRQHDLLALQCRRHALAVPALECLSHACPHLRREAERSRQLGRGHAVVLDGLARAQPVADELDPQASPLRQAAAGTEVAQGEQLAGHARHVRRAGVGLERQVVPEPLRLLVGVDVATDPRDQARVVDEPPCLLVEAQALGEPQRDQRLAQPVLQRLAHPQIGPERDHRDQLGEPDASPCRRSRHVASLGARQSTIFQKELLRLIFPSAKCHRSHPRTSMRSPVRWVPRSVHSETPRSPQSQCESSP